MLAEGETKLAGWVLLSPSEIDVVRPRKGGKYEEKVLLLSQKATYVVNYDYTLQKVKSSLSILPSPRPASAHSRFALQVSSYIRIPNSDVLGLQTGTYIISALDASGSDPVENFGLLLRYRASHTTERIRTYSLRTTSLKKKRVGLKDLTLPALASGQMLQPDEADRDNAAETHFVAFKALRKDAVKVTGPDGTTTELPSKSRNSGGETAKDIVEDIAARVREECDKVGIADFVVEKDIISLAESKAAMSIVDRLSHR